MEEHAISLAVAQRVTMRPKRLPPLTHRLNNNARVLLDSYRAVAAAVDEKRPVTPAAEWLVDNYHLIEAQIREVRADLPAGYYRQLPKLAEGPFAGYPRVFGIAWAFVAHTDSRFDPDILCRFVRAYQRVQPLTIGELWAVAITLRIVLIENMRRIAKRIVQSAAGRAEADILADRVLGTGGRPPQPIAEVFKHYENQPLPTSLTVQFIKRLRDQDPDVTPALAWLEERLTKQGTTGDDLVRDELHSYGSTNATARNVITSMRLISDLDWSVLFERISLVDEAMREASNFAEMDFATRNQYRTAIEILAQHSPRGEMEVAQAALRKAAEALHANPGDPRTHDPGYYLIGDGRRGFEAAMGFKSPWRPKLHRSIQSLGIGGYVGIVAAVAALVLFVPLYLLAHLPIGGWALAALTILGIAPALDLAVALSNRGLAHLLAPTLLPALAVHDGIPAHLRTVVAVPTLLTTPAGVEEQIARLEIHYLTNPDDNFHFALLTDWTDAASETVEGDAELLGIAVAGIARLNQLYRDARKGDRFHLLHRRRVWNASEGCWMGWERKRGKLHELNRALRGATGTHFLDAGGGPASLPPGVRYVIAMDSDTRLPRDAAARLVGKMAHPLNRPRFDTSAGRVVEGYAILQPRVTPSLPVGREGSPFQQVFSSAGGIDPYAAAVSDVYQDLFQEGSYTGKGIYDIDAFEAALEHRVPDNALLSHDLFEGIFARAGLASDVEVVEDFPARYDVAMSRQHRWARGDWQLLPWIVGRGPRGERGTRESKVPPVGRWKMADNLRRTLTAPAIVGSLLTAWALDWRAAGIWTVFVAATMAIPPLLSIPRKLLPTRAGISLRGYSHALATDIKLALALTGLTAAFQAHQAWLMADAITRTLYRLSVSRRHLLEWVTAAQTQRVSRPDLASFCRRMIGAVAIGLAALVEVAVLVPENAITALPFALAWIASPIIAWWTSRTAATAGPLTVEDRDADALRLVARRTWRFFETFVTPADNMLPPDNFQEDPAEVLAHRTSPTNIGLYLLSCVASCDFGWATRSETLERLEATIASMRKLEGLHGHLFNWYDTQDLRPLEPRYVSSVDSGNLAGHLIAVANACREWNASQPSGLAARAGILDALNLARESLAAAREHVLFEDAAHDRFHVALGDLAVTLSDAGAWARDLDRLLSEAAECAARVAEAAAELAGENSGAADFLHWADATAATAESHRRANALAGYERASQHHRIDLLESQARAMARAMDFNFLFDTQRKLLSIGYAVEEGKLDPSCYDLLASEARLASFFAIANSDIPARHWFRLGRSVTPIDSGAALISWSGSMFEYLMPSLVMRAPVGSLLEQTARLIVRRQIQYAEALGMPWGVSESAYNMRDAEFTYQYSNFGVPGLGLKRGLSENAVVAPYATGLAAMVDPHQAARNFARLAASGVLGRYGFYEAVDYTASRVPHGQDKVIVRAHMAHHQGMTIVAIANALFSGVMRTRFHAEPIIQATELLLQERTPRNVAVAHPRAEEVHTTAVLHDAEPSHLRRLRGAHDATPAAHLLSNGRYTVMLTAAGSGFSRWGNLAVTRWREDTTRDDWGAYIYVRDVSGGAVWSAGYQPSAVDPDGYDVTLAEDRAVFTRRDGTITTTHHTVVSTECDCEIRRVSVTNSGYRAAKIELTSYAELALAPAGADLAHTAFSKLFVETEFLPELGAILATRRSRSPSDPPIWAAHFTVVEGDTDGAIEIETDRARFLGRGGDVRAPAALFDGRALSNTTGRVLDPVFAIRRRVRIARGATARVAFCTIVASSREEVLDLIDKHRDPAAFDRTVTLAWTQAHVMLRHLEIEPAEANLFQRLAGHLLFAAPNLRPSSDIIRSGAGKQSGLWQHGISGDLPIVLVRIDEIDDVEIVRQLLRAHEYWRMKQLAVDLVILNDKASSYSQDLQTALETLVRKSQSRPRFADIAINGAVFVLRADLIPAESRMLLAAVARAVFVGSGGRLSDQLNRVEVPAEHQSLMPRTAPRVAGPKMLALAPDLEFFNGLGGFAKDGREYVTILGPGQQTPAPWINVVANPSFGFQVAAEGSGFTWALNSRENQLTPWSNDPVVDRPGEVIYLRDEDTGDVWSPTAAPIRQPSTLYVARHGQGYSRFEHTSHGLALDLVQFVPLDAPVKIARLTIRNLSGRRRRVSVTAYVDWVLGASRGASAPFVATDIDEESGAMLARNPWNMSFGSRVAFLDLAGRQTMWTGDRKEFLGRNGTLAAPAALATRDVLSGRVGAGFDSCGALQTHLKIEPDGIGEIVVLLGQTDTVQDARALIAQYRAADLNAALKSVTAYWDDVVETVQVRTPDRAMDIMTNRWLLYQTLVCRIWARSAFYQASGAYGFRDQLQDTTALAVARPQLTREHLLRAAARQFEEGDVQHWWLPVTGHGVRTRNSDDLLWLAYTAAHYVAVTADAAVLDEQVPFLRAPVLEPGEDEKFFLPEMSNGTASLFEHCARALDHSLTVGAHSLPLIGTGDWNDGMNRVGEHGKGESVWLGWFLYSVLAAFVPIAAARGETGRTERWREHGARLRVALEKNGWDGAWYRRGYFDDGTPLGSAASDECRIDSIAQSWGVISGAADPARVARAMDEVDRQLTRRDDGLALLFTPPFEKTLLDPGYIKGYPPGIRENGGQYTHAALWSVLAFTKLGDGDRAGELFAMLNPINRARSREDVARNRVEPYAVAADVYSVAPHVGRGGWTWYTGSAAWMHRVGVEGILGLRLAGASLALDPCIPKSWPRFEITLRYRSAQYEIAVENPHHVSRGIEAAELDGVAQTRRPLIVGLADDGAVHQLRVILG